MSSDGTVLTWSTSTYTGATEVSGPGSVERVGKGVVAHYQYCQEDAKTRQFQYDLQPAQYQRWRDQRGSVQSPEPGAGQGSEVF